MKLRILIGGNNINDVKAFFCAIEITYEGLGLWKISYY